MTSTGHGVQEGTSASQLNRSPQRGLPEGSCSYSNLQINLPTLSSCPFLMEQAAWTHFMTFQKVINTAEPKHGDWSHLGRPPQDSGLGGFLRGSLRGMLVPHRETAVKKRTGTGNTGQGGRKGGSCRSHGGLHAMNSSRLCLESDTGDCGCGLQPLR